jgi:hypothetical protein
MRKKLALISLIILVGGCDYNFIGPTINNNNSNSNNNDNRIDIHDVVNFVPSPIPSMPVPAPGGGTEIPLPVPVTAQALAQKVADSNPMLLAKACPETYGESGWAFLDLVVRTLQASDARWGYFVKPDGSISRDVIAYKATSDNTGAWGVDIILDRCGTNKFSWQVLGFDAATQWSAIRSGS